jgi:hypothetical protein
MTLLSWKVHVLLLVGPKHQSSLKMMVRFVVCATVIRNRVLGNSS